MSRSTEKSCELSLDSNGDLVWTGENVHRSLYAPCVSSAFTKGPFAGSLWLVVGQRYWSYFFHATQRVLIFLQGPREILSVCSPRCWMAAADQERALLVTEICQIGPQQYSIASFSSILAEIIHLNESGTPQSLAGNRRKSPGAYSSPYSECPRSQQLHLPENGADRHAKSNSEDPELAEGIKIHLSHLCYANASAEVVKAVGDLWSAVIVAKGAVMPKSLERLYHEAFRLFNTKLAQGILRQWTREMGNKNNGENVERKLLNYNTRPFWWPIKTRCENPSKLYGDGKPACSKERTLINRFSYLEARAILYYMFAGSHGGHFPFEALSNILEVPHAEAKHQSILDQLFIIRRAQGSECGKELLNSHIARLHAYAAYGK